MTLENMIVRVKARLKEKGRKIIHERYVNNNRNYEIHTETESFLLHWSKEPFFAASKLIPEFGKGIGISVDKITADHFIKNNFFEMDRMIILYQWTAQKIYYINCAEFQRQRYVYPQTNGEYVYVVPVRTIIAWE